MHKNWEITSTSDKNSTYIHIDCKRSRLGLETDIHLELRQQHVALSSHSLLAYEELEVNFSTHKAAKADIYQIALFLNSITNVITKRVTFSEIKANVYRGRKDKAL